MVTHALPTGAKVPTAMITKTTKQMLTDATGPQKRDKIMVEISFKIFHHNQTPYKLKKKNQQGIEGAAHRLTTHNKQLLKV